MIAEKIKQKKYVNENDEKLKERCNRHSIRTEGIEERIMDGMFEGFFDCNFDGVDDGFSDAHSG